MLPTLSVRKSLLLKPRSRRPSRASRWLAAAAVVGGLCAAPAQAAFLYTFTFGTLNASYQAASIVFTSDAIAAEGDFLDYVSGGINGCIPRDGGIEYRAGTALGERGGFGTLNDGFSCGDGNGAAVDGLFFRPDDDPNRVGTFASASDAGRFFVREQFGGDFSYTAGTLTIASTDANGVPEPGTLALVGLSLAGMCGLWSMRRRMA